MGLLMLNGHAYTGFTEPAMIYSDEEREVGVWRDGKPLYQKTFHIAQNLSSSMTVTHNISNLDFCVNVEGVALFSSGNDLYAEPICTGSEMANGWGVGIVDINKTTFGVQIGNARISASGLTALEVTLKYTKTTDVAGSGTWTTQGGYAHHYSTTEQVIGTWIDGKPIYEKIYSGSTNDLMNIIDNSVGYIEELIDIKASTTSPNGNKYTLYYGGNNDYLRVWLDDNGTSIRLYIGSSYPPRPVSYKIILQYTKTTD